MQTTHMSFQGGRALVRRLRGTDSAKVLNLLSERQYVQPRSSIEEVLNDSGQAVGVCPAVAARAMDWMGMDHGRAIGRLRRDELSELARCLTRFARRTGGRGCAAN
jgi:hypothetical protein